MNSDKARDLTTACEDLVCIASQDAYLSQGQSKAAIRRADNAINWILEIALERKPTRQERLKTI